MGVGLGVLAELMEEEEEEEEVTAVVGAKGRHDPDRVAVRHAHEPGQVTLGGRRSPSPARACAPPRARRLDGHRAPRRPKAPATAHHAEILSLKGDSYRLRDKDVAPRPAPALPEPD